LALKGAGAWSGGLEEKEEGGLGFSLSSAVDLYILCQLMRKLQGNNLSSISNPVWRSKKLGGRYVRD
jgi:hypothetical protein